MAEERDSISRSVDGLQDMLALSRKTGTNKKIPVPSSKRNFPVKRDLINLDPSMQLTNRRCQSHFASLEIPEYFPALSIRIMNAMDDLGAERCTVMERRKTFLRRENMWTIAIKLTYTNHPILFNFESQYEGTTTPVLNSDIDLLHSISEVNIMTHWRDWEAGMINLLMLHDDITPPLQYLLSVIKKFSPEPETSRCDDNYVMKDSGQILFSSERWKQESEQIQSEGGEITINGPSVSFMPNWDIVQASPVRKPLPEIQHSIDRCRGRHWPPIKLLDAARVAPSFLVPAGHSDSDYKSENGDCLQS